MHICRIRYTVLGLLIYYLQSAFSRTCGSDFEDIASRTVMADLVFEGQMHRNVPIKHKPGFHNIKFKVLTLIKGEFPGYPTSSWNNNNHHLNNQNHDDKRKRSRTTIHHQNAGRLRNTITNHRNHHQNHNYNSHHLQKNQVKKANQLSKHTPHPPMVQVGQFGPTSDETECVASFKSIQKGNKYLVFLRLNPSNKTQSSRSTTKPSRNYHSTTNSRDRHASRHHTSPSPKSQPPSDIVYMMSSFPKESNNKTKREAVDHSRMNGRKPTVKKLTESREIKLGDELTLICRVEGFPTPEIVWIRNGLLLNNNEDNISIKKKKNNSILSIKSVRVEDTGQYQCHGRNVKGQSDLNSTTVTVMNSTTNMPFSELCDSGLSTYCLNKGTCYRLLTTNSKVFCHCTDKYVGSRCQEKDSGYAQLMGKRRKRRSSRNHHHYYELYQKRLLEL